MSRSAILLYWLLLLVPTVLIGFFGWQLIKAERERIDEAAEAARAERARLVAENIELFFEEVKTGIITGLGEIHGGDPQSGLREWREANPLVRQAFLWRPEDGLVFPPDDEAATGEDEERFRQRFREILGERDGWPKRDIETRAPERRIQPMEERADTRPPPSPRQEVFMVEQRARAAAKPEAPAASPQRQQRGLSEPAFQMDAEAEDAIVTGDFADAFGRALPAYTVNDSGWLPVEDDGEFHIVGWVEFQPGGVIRAAELQLDEIVARLPPLFAPANPQTEVVALFDRHGTLIYTNGPVPPEGGRALSVSGTFPGWRLTAYPLPETSSAGRGFFLLSALLLGVFLASILSGGSLLFWQAHRHAADARRKSSFVSNVSHELKTPLTTIRMYAELLGDERVRPEKKPAYLDVINSEAQRLTRLVNNVLDFSRIEQKRKNYNLEEFDGGEIVAGIIAHQRPRIESAGLRLTIKTPEEPLRVRADRDAVEQICLNLLDNAVKYAAEGKNLEVDLSDNGDAACIDFLDRGPGVPSAHRAKLFSQFHRVDDSLTAKQPGCGLGLNIARQLARGQGGDLTYQQRPGGGSVFRLTCPLASK